MHGIKRVKQTPEEREVRKQRELAKIGEFNALTAKTLSLKQAKEWTQEAFDLTTRLLQMNPEFYTIWNYRRDILVNGIFSNSDAAAQYKVLSDELGMTMVALKSHPKVYWIWNHRRWCLERIPDTPPSGVDSPSSPSWSQAAWEKELYFVEKMLDVDPRNFHAWNYRRCALAGMPVKRPEETELAYTERKISSNFSNFSAWHQRSKILMSLWSQGKLDEAESREQEFELLRNAMYTDPNDQSVWMYHRWLIGTGSSKDFLKKEIAAIQELLDEQPDAKWCMESIVHYKRMLVKQCGDPKERDSLAEDCQSLLKRLIDIDPFRRQRYHELSEETRRAAKVGQQT